MHFIPRKKAVRVLHPQCARPPSYAVHAVRDRSPLPRQATRRYLRLISLFSLPALIPDAVLRKKNRAALGGVDSAVNGRPVANEFLLNVRRVDVLLLIGVNLLILLMPLDVFFFMKSLALQMGAGNVGSSSRFTPWSMIVVPSAAGRISTR